MRILKRLRCWIIGHNYQCFQGSPLWIECTSCGKWERLIIKRADHPECKTYEGIERCNKTIWSDSEAMCQDKNVTVTREKS